MGAIRELVAKFESEADNRALQKTDSLMDKLTKKTGVVGSALRDLYRKAEAEKQAKAAKAAFDNLDEAGKKALAAAVAAEDAAAARAQAASGAMRNFAAAATAAGAAAVAFARDFVAEAENLQYTSDRLRTTTRDLQLMGAVGRSVGLDLNATVGVLSTLRGKVDEAARGIGDGGYTFRRLGVDIRDSNRQVRPLAQIFGDVATGLSRVERQSRRVILTERLLGSEGRRFISLFADGKDALQDFAAIMDESGGGISQRAIDAGLRLSRAWNIAGLSMDSARSRIAEFLLPILERLVRGGTKVLNFLNKTTIAANGMRIAVVALGVYGARAGIMWAAANAPLILQWGLIGAAIGLVVLVVDDLINLFTGGRSVIGGFIDEMFGVGQAAEIVNDIKGRFEEFMYFVRLVKDEVTALWDSLHIGYNPRTDPRNQATRTRIQAPGTALRLNTALPTVVVPVTAPSAPGRGRAVAGINVPVPGGGPRVARTQIDVRSEPRLQVNINNPLGNGREIAAAATPAMRRVLQDNDRNTVRALEDSGMMSSRTGERED